MVKNESTPPPSGYSTVCPYLLVSSIEKQVAFLQQVFYASVKEVTKTPEGQVKQAEVYIGESVIMIGKASKDFPAREAMTYVFVNHADTVFQRALQFGAKPVLEPGDRLYGFREGGFLDDQGNTWWVAHEIERLPTEAKKTT